MNLADPAGSMLRGVQIASQIKQLKSQNALADLYSSQGPAMMAGDPNALNSLAQFDPAAALGIKQTQQQITLDDARLAEIRQQSATAAAQAAAAMSEAQRKAEADQMATVMRGASYFVSNGDKAGYDQFMAAQGIDPSQIPPFEQAPAMLAMIQGGLDALTTFDKRQPEPAPSPDWRAATPQEAGAYGAAGGQINLKTGEFKPINPPSNGVTVMGPDGKPSVMIGGPAQNQTAAQDSAQATAADTVWTAATKARALVSNTSTGVLGAGASYVPTTDAAELRRQVAVMTANAKISTLNAMRAASKTGGALGAVTEKESQMLADAAGALDPNASPAQFAAQLDNYEKTLFRIVYGQADGDKVFAATRNGTDPITAYGQLKVQGQTAGVSADYSKMQPNDLLAIDPSKLSGADLQAYIDRIGQLTGNQ